MSTPASIKRRRGPGGWPVYERGRGPLIDPLAWLVQIEPASQSGRNR
jgi:hypothetical protein